MDAAFDALETASRCLADAKDQVEASPPDEAKLAAAQQQLAFLQMQACTFAFEVSQLQAILQSKSAGITPISRVCLTKVSRSSDLVAASADNVDPRRCPRLLSLARKNCSCNQYS